ncbi:hypothetical protein SAMN05421636_104439 [Pricia antarctica]|uniref:Uncharacterized protein n=1 Tax=Pricia antarctica TaxID=641691 RepID=A0A1G7C6S8_9FLAO|nr:hypothetical protein [Pricia antarctica]SDE35009.1 hypothetical protein SAMN05421636_104439 [Pricia antarctica]
MDTLQNPRNTEWLAPEEMHEQSKRWFSELSFIKDEQQFLNNLIQSFSIKPIEVKEFALINDFKMAIAENQHRLIPILKQVQKHRNQLEIMLDSVNQHEMEKAYKKTHENLYRKLNKYFLDYRTVKERGFAKLTHILKNTKKIALGNPEYRLSSTEQPKMPKPDFGEE